MKALIVSPGARFIGNQRTARRYQRILRELGHRVLVRETYSGEPCDLMIALHARRSHGSIRRFHSLHPGLPLVVVLTGTDLYRDLDRDPGARRSLELAERIVVLQKKGLERLDASVRAKARVMYQSAPAAPSSISPPRSFFRVCVIGNLRREKDPFRTALALRRLPGESGVQVLHIGGALDARHEREARAAMLADSRYRWVGELPHWKTRRKLAASHLVSITSRMEGGSNVLCEALASSVPVLAARIDGLIGTLGEDYPGYFPVGDTGALALLIREAARRGPFYRALKKRCAALAPLTRPRRERAAWRRLLRELSRGRTRIPAKASAKS